ncbi:hypothetical protein K4G89_24155, partial [Mycobacterium tuberculosis]|nr:hypothetical protein [Mycobacterium tuberculosis]
YVLSFEKGGVFACSVHGWASAVGFVIVSLSCRWRRTPMHGIFTMMLAVYDRAALMLICLFFLIRLRLFRELLHKSAHT